LREKFFQEHAEQLGAVVDAGFPPEILDDEPEERGYEVTPVRTAAE